MMPSITLPRFDDRTGNPERDNAARRANRELRSRAEQNVRVSGLPRKPKKRVVAVSRARYVAIFVGIAARMAVRAGSESQAG